jgi:ribosomal protein L11 methyltransferase
MLTWYAIELFFADKAVQEQGIYWLEEQGFGNCELLDDLDDLEYTPVHTHYGIRTYVDSKRTAQKLIQQGQEAFSASLVVSRYTAHQEQDWMEGWRKEARSQELYPGIWVGPPEYPPEFADKVTDNANVNMWIPIVPRMVFGSGHHPTTALMVQAMVAYRPILVGNSVLDIGTGSGVLSFAAKALGAKHAVGFDIDPLCVSNLWENSQENIREESSREAAFYLGSLENIRVGWNPAVILINMIRTEAEPLVEHSFPRLSKGGVLVWSGLQENDKPKVLQQIGSLGGVLHREWNQGDWWCYSFVVRT